MMPLRCRYAIPETMPSQPRSAKPGGVGARSAVRKSPPAQYSSTRQWVGGSTTAPMYCTTCGWRSCVRAVTSARNSASFEMPLPATLTATLAPRHCAW